METGTRIFMEEYTNFSPTEKVQFADTVKVLLDEGLLWREEESKRQVYLFLKQHTDLIKEYLEVMGWKLYYHEQCTTFQIVHNEGHYRRRLSLDTSIWLLLLRLLYAEQEESTTPRLTRYPTVTVETLIRRYNELPNSRKFKKTSLEDAIRQFQQLPLIRSANGGSIRLKSNEQVIELLPPLEVVIPAENAVSIAALLSEYIPNPQERSSDAKITDDDELL